MVFPKALYAHLETGSHISPLYRWQYISSKQITHQFLCPTVSKNLSVLRSSKTVLVVVAPEACLPKVGGCLLDVSAPCPPKSAIQMSSLVSPLTSTLVLNPSQNVPFTPEPSPDIHYQSCCEPHPWPQDLSPGPLQQKRDRAFSAKRLDRLQNPAARILSSRNPWQQISPTFMYLMCRAPKPLEISPCRNLMRAL